MYTAAELEVFYRTSAANCQPARQRHAEMKARTERNIAVKSRIRHNRTLPRTRRRGLGAIRLAHRRWNWELVKNIKAPKNTQHMTNPLDKLSTQILKENAANIRYLDEERQRLLKLLTETQETANDGLSVEHICEVVAVSPGDLPTVKDNELELMKRYLGTDFLIINV